MRRKEERSKQGQTNNEYLDCLISARLACSSKICVLLLLYLFTTSYTVTSWLCAASLPLPVVQPPLCLPLAIQSLAGCVQLASLSP